jgi:hypothetical protein
MKNYFLAAIVTVVFCSGLGGAAHAGMPSVATGAIEYLAYKDGRISLKTHEVPLVSLLQEIVGSTNIQIVTASRIQGDQLINADVQNKSLAETLRLLLAGYNYLVCYHTEPSFRGLQLIAGSTFSQAGMELLPFSDGSKGAVTAAINGSESARNGSGNVQQNKTVHASQEWNGGPRVHVPTNEQRAKQESFTDVAGSRTTRPSRAASGDEHKSAQDSTRGNPGTDEEWNGSGDFAEVEGDPAAIEQAALQKNWKREDFLRYKIEILSRNIESGSSDMQYEVWIQRKDKKYVTHDRDLLEHYEKELVTLLESS